MKCDQYGKPTDIVEKPSKYISNLAITGLYFFDNDCIELSKKIVPSKRGELEITSLLNIYLKEKKLSSNFWEGVLLGLIQEAMIR